MSATATQWLKPRLFVWWLRLGLVIVLGLVVLIIPMVWYGNYTLQKDVDHLFKEALPEGELMAAYKHADPTFRAIYPWQAFEEFAAKNRAIFERDKVTGLSVIWWNNERDEFVVEVKTRVAD